MSISNITNTCLHRQRLESSTLVLFLNWSKYCIYM